MKSLLSRLNCFFFLHLYIVFFKFIYLHLHTYTTFFVLYYPKHVVIVEYASTIADKNKIIYKIIINKTENGR
jgi:hypothetical protein